MSKQIGLILASLLGPPRLTLVDLPPASRPDRYANGFNKAQEKARRLRRIAQQQKGAA